MICPDCGHIQSCPCQSCQSRHPTEKPWINAGDNILCGACGFMADANWWFYEEGRQYEQRDWEKKKGEILSSP